MSCYQGKELAVSCQWHYEHLAVVLGRFIFEILLGSDNEEVIFEGASQCSASTSYKQGFVDARRINKGGLVYVLTFAI